MLQICIVQSAAVLSLANWTQAPPSTLRNDALSGLGRGGGVGGAASGCVKPSSVATLLCAFHISFLSDSFVSKVMHSSLVAA